MPLAAGANPVCVQSDPASFAAWSDGANVRYVDLRSTESTLKHIALDGAIAGTPAPLRDPSRTAVLTASGTLSLLDFANGNVLSSRKLPGATLLAATAQDDLLLVAAASPPALHILDSRTLATLRTHAIADRKGRTAQATRIVDAAPRRSFMVFFDHLGEFWEIPYDAKAEPVFEGLVHDYRLGEGIADAARFPLRRIPLDAPARDGDFDTRFEHVTVTDGEQGVKIINVNVRRSIATMQTEHPVAPGNGVAWLDREKRWVGVQEKSGDALALLAGPEWKIAGRIDPGGRVLCVISDTARHALWFAVSRNGKPGVAKFDTLERRIAATLALPGAGEWAALALAGDTLIAILTGGKSYVIDPGSGAIRAQRSVLP